MERFIHGKPRTSSAYEQWREARIDSGYIVNESPGDFHGTRLHHASCGTLQHPIDEGMDLLAYPKHPSTSRSELERTFPGVIVCGICGAEPRGACLRLPDCRIASAEPKSARVV